MLVVTNSRNCSMFMPSNRSLMRRRELISWLLDPLDVFLEQRVAGAQRLQFSHHLGVRRAGLRLCSRYSMRLVLEVATVHAEVFSSVPSIAASASRV